MIATGVALVMSIFLGGRLILSDGASTTSPTSGASGTPSAPPTTPRASPSPSSSPVTSLPVVPASPPRRLSAPGLDVGFDESIEPRAGGFTAASTAEAARWGSRGVPASPGTETVYLIGKVYVLSPSAFNGLDRLASGDTVQLRTQAGDRLRYRVTDTRSRSAVGLLRNPEFTESKPGRLVLIGILYDADDDQRTGNYLVVTAQLDGAQRG